MATDEPTINALTRLAKQLADLGVKSKDLKILRGHIREQKKQIGWIYGNGKWIYLKNKKRSRP